MWVPSLGQEDPVKKEMATHSSILAWRIPWTEDPGGLQSMSLQTVGHNWVTEHKGKTEGRTEAANQYSVLNKFILVLLIYVLPIFLLDLCLVTDL